MQPDPSTRPAPPGSGSRFAPRYFATEPGEGGGGSAGAGDTASGGGPWKWVAIAALVLLGLLGIWYFMGGGAGDEAEATAEPPTMEIPTEPPTVEATLEAPTEAPTEAATATPLPTEPPTVAPTSTPVVIVVTQTAAPTLPATPSPAPTAAGVFELWCDPCQLDDDTTCGAVRWRIVGVKEASIEHDGKTQGATGPDGSIGNICLQPGDKSTYTMTVVWPDDKTESKSVTLERED